MAGFFSGLGFSDIITGVGAFMDYKNNKKMMGIYDKQVNQNIKASEAIMKRNKASDDRHDNIRSSYSKKVAAGNVLDNANEKENSFDNTN